MNDNKKNTWIWIIAIILILLGAMWYFSSSSPVIPAPSVQNIVTESSPSPESAIPTPPPSESSASSTVSTKTTTIVIYGANGFSPSTVTIHQGDSVTFKNQSSIDMLVASNPHPTHQAYSGTTRVEHCPDTSGVAFDQCSVGTAYTFTFQKIGTWGYHNHSNPTDKGTVIVQ